MKSIGGTEFGRNVADYALQFVGNPYVYGGTSLTGGTDCSGYTQSVYRHFGVSIPRTSGNRRDLAGRYRMRIWSRVIWSAIPAMWPCISEEAALYTPVPEKRALR